MALIKEASFIKRDYSYESSVTQMLKDLDQSSTLALVR